MHCYVPIELDWYAGSISCTKRMLMIRFYGIQKIVFFLFRERDWDQAILIWKSQTSEQESNLKLFPQTLKDEGTFEMNFHISLYYIQYACVNMYLNTCEIRINYSALEDVVFWNRK